MSRTALSSFLVALVAGALLLVGSGCEDEPEKQAGGGDAVAADSSVANDVPSPPTDGASETAEVVDTGSAPDDPGGGADTSPAGDCWFTTQTCASHPPKAASTLSAKGNIAGVAFDMAACDWELKLKDNVLEHAVNACPESWPKDQGSISIWCTTPENVQVLMRLTVKKEMALDAAVFNGKLTYFPPDGPFQTNGKLVEKSATLTTYDLCGMRAAGSYSARWEGQPAIGPVPETFDGEVSGTFDFSWSP